MSKQLSADLASLRIDRAAPKRSRGWLRAFVIFGVLGGVGWAGYTYGKPYVESRVFKAEVAVTEIASVSPAQASVNLTATGYVVPQSTAKIGAKIVGKIVKVDVKEGDEVKAGHVLFELDPEDQKAAVTSAQARVAAASAKVATAKAQLAESDLELQRQKKLVEAGAIARSGVDDLEGRRKSLHALIKAAEAEVYAAQAEVQSLTTGLKNLKIAAPIDGTAMTRPANLGDIASPDEPLLELADFSTLLVEVDVPESRLGMVKRGGPCEVVLDSFGSERFPGEVVMVAPRLNRSKATGIVKVKLKKPPENLRPEMSARVSFLDKPLDEAKLKEPPKIIVPGAAVVDHAGGKAVWVVEEGKLRLVGVKLGEAFGTGFVVESGPPPGTRVVKDPPKDLADGQAVKEKSPS
jgi:RND family efflux transporter MFP subunit